MILSILDNIRGINKITGVHRFGQYIINLNRSKISIIPPSRKVMTQKYLEYAACGTLIIGDKPYGHDDIFQDNVSFVHVTDWERLEDTVKYYLEHEDERLRIAKECNRRITDNLTVDRMVSDFEGQLLKFQG